MFCNKCGKQLEEGNLLCPDCGADNTALVKDENVVAPEIKADEVSAIENAHIVEEIPAVVEAPAVEEVSAVAQAPAEDTVSQETAQPEQAAAQAVPAGYAPSVPLQLDASIQAPSPEKKKKKIGLFIVLGVIFVALVVAGVFAYSYFTRPDVVVKRAAQKTAEDYQAFIKDNNIISLITSLDALIAEGEFSVDVNVKDATDDNEYDVDVKLNISKPDKELSAAVDYNGEHIADVYADNEYLAASIPELTDEVLGVPTKDFGNKLLESEFGELSGISENEEAADFIENISIDLFAGSDYKQISQISADISNKLNTATFEESDKKIDGIGEKAQVYSVELEGDIALELYDKYIKSSEESADAILGEGFTQKVEELFSDFEDEAEDDEDESLREILEKANFRFYVVVEDGKISAVAITAYCSEHEVDEDVVIYLMGEGNSFNEIKIVNESDGEKYTQVHLVKSEEAVEIKFYRLEDDDENEDDEKEDEEDKDNTEDKKKSEVKLNQTLIIKDAEGKIEFVDPEDEDENFTVIYSSESGKCNVDFESKKIIVGITVGKLEKIEKLEVTADFFALNEEELYELIMGFNMGAFASPMDIVYDELTVTVTDNFEYGYKEGFSEFYYGDNVTMYICKIPFKYAGAMLNYSLEEYAQLYESNESSTVTHKIEDDRLEITVRNEYDGGIYVGIIYVYKTENAFWEVSFISDENWINKNSDLIEEWANSITFEYEYATA